MPAELQTRFGECLKVDYDIDPEALGMRVPHMVFQPLVENAIKHGISSRAAGGRLEISARVVDDERQLAVHDDGVGLRNSRPDSGLGLKNTRERLAVLYGDQHQFKLRSVPNGGTRAEITIPLRGHADLNLNR